MPGSSRVAISLTDEYTLATRGHTLVPAKPSFAYTLSRREFRYRRLFTAAAVFTTLFNGGLIPFYLVCTKILFLRSAAS